jgi:hypothetical protein
MSSFSPAAVHRCAVGLAAVTVFTLAPLAAAPARGALSRAEGEAGQAGTRGGEPTVSATLEQCVTAVVQAERSATFAGEMTAIPGSARMTMRIDVQERMPEEALFHTVSAPGLGVWRGSDPKVRVYRYLKQVTNLTSPALYRASVRFRWLNARGHVIRRAERLTPRCAQPASPSPTPETPSTRSTSPPSSG